MPQPLVTISKSEQSSQSTAVTALTSTAMTVVPNWHVEPRSVCIYSQLKSCTSSEVAAMLEGVLRHCTDMTIKHHMADSHGQSEIGFAFSHLLGFRLLPRLKPIHSQRLALVEAGTQDDYPHLKAALGKAINWDVIRQWNIVNKSLATCTPAFVSLSDNRVALRNACLCIISTF